MSQLYGRGALDPRWTTHNVPVVSSFMLADIKVIRKESNGTVSYDQSTGEYTGSFTVVHASLMGRVQPYGIIGDQVVGQDTTGRRLMRVQIKQKNTGIKLDDMIIVTDCPDDPELCNFTLEVRGSIGSSNSWVTDLVCEANLKY